MNSTLTIPQRGRTVVIRQSQIGAEGPTASSAVLKATQNLSAGDLVNVYSNAGELCVRQASALSAGYEAAGFVLAAVPSGQYALVYFAGRNDQHSGMTVGPVFLSTTPGRVQSTPPVGAGQVVQPVGHALSATSFLLQVGVPVQLAQ